MPFSRFWMPLCANGAVTVVAQSIHPVRAYNPLCHRVPSDLQLVTRLQEQLLQLTRPRKNEHLVAVREAEGDADARSAGPRVILGGPFANQAARAFCAQSTELQFRFDPTSEYLIDSRAGTVFEPIFRAVDGDTFELVRDYGLLTICRSKRTATPECELMIGAMGVHAP